MNPTWKRPLKRSLIITPLPAGKRGYCGPICVHRFIYQALSNAGIENRSPYSPGRILKIWLLARGRPAAVRSHCLTQLDSMDKPAPGFSHAYSFIAVFSFIVLVWTLLSPQTADTNFVTAKKNSILEVIIQPMQDIDGLEIVLPMSGDYHQAPYSPGLREAGGLAGPGWILQQRESDYTLQLVSASELGSLQRFCTKHAICPQAAYYQSNVQGKTLYRLLYGIYPNNRAAQDALQALPDELLQLSPWSRQFQQIQPEIKS